VIRRGAPNFNPVCEEDFTVSAVQSCNGIASGQRVNLSIIVNKYLKPSVGGRESMISM